jgi:hypothetical protein
MVPDGWTPEAVAMAQGLLYVLTGLWPLVSMGTFLKVTGPKTDLWLVKTVGAVVLVVGAALLLAGLRRSVSPEIALVAVGCAAALTAVDLAYVARRVIGPVYLLDAAAEAGLLVWWALVAARGAGIAA